MCWSPQSSASFLVAVEEWISPWCERTGRRSSGWSGGSSRRRAGSSRRVVGRKVVARKLKRALRRSLPLASGKRPPLEESSRSRPRGHSSSVEKTPEWAQQEVRHVVLSDARLVKRLARLIGQFAAQPNASIPQACGTWGETKAAYRFFDNARVYPQQIRVGHQHACLERIGEHPLILGVHATTSLDYTTPPKTKEVGPLEHPQHHGVFVHSTLAVTPEGVPLGILGQQVWARDPDTVGQRHPRKERPFPEKESFRGYAAEQEMLAALPKEVRTVTVADRESDIYALVQAPRRKGADLLIRTSWDRRGDDPQQHLWATVNATPIQGRTLLRLRRTPNRKPRTALLSVRFARVCLLPPKKRPVQDNLRPQWVHAGFADEEAAPQGVEPVSWMLLTTLPVETFSEALQYLQWYTYRWLVERYHFILESGCRIEERQLGTGMRLQRCLAVYTSVAWRVLWLTYLARETPTASCELALSREEWEALWCIHHNVAVPQRSLPPSNKRFCGSPNWEDSSPENETEPPVPKCFGKDCSVSTTTPKCGD